MDRPPPTGLERRIAALIAASGPIGVDAFMAQALYDPTDGYYVVGKPIGATGDFTTSPEISQMFGELVGLWLAQSWIDLGAPDPFHLIELGPGRGTLMADIVRVGAKVPGFVAAMRLHLVESNQHLRGVQEAKLSQFSPNWHDSLSTIPQGPSLILGNEFLDCMPIRQYVKTDGGWCEKQVGVNTSGRLIFGLSPLCHAPPRTARSDDAIGTVREIAPHLPGFVATLADRFAHHAGRALMIDYGSRTDSPGDTLQALYRHTKINPLDHVGGADITAHVDFVELASLSRAAHLACQGPVSQSAFLSHLGLQARAQALINANPACANDVRLAVERLGSEAHMGALFSVICLDSPINDGRGPPLGF
jgi:NADH dehydrogenase [ubiquinone] 1 alpha subcomplex assembly factor 7